MSSENSDSRDQPTDTLSMLYKQSQQDEEEKQETEDSEESSLNDESNNNALDGEILADLFTVTATNKGYDISVDQTQAVVTLLALATGNDDLLKHYFKQYGNGENSGKQKLLLTPQQQELLVFGYIRVISKYCIPNEIYYVCQEYYTTSYNTYKPNDDYLSEPHHENAMRYVQCLQVAPSKSLECYWILPPQHGHGTQIIWITSADYKRVTDNEYLNDAIVNFASYYIYSSWPSSFKENVFIFNSFFWPKLIQLFSKHQTTSFEKISRWTKHIKSSIFNKQYIIIPKCVKKHWELIIICNPVKVLNNYLNNNNNTEDTQISYIVILDSLLCKSKYCDFNCIRYWLNCEANKYIQNIKNIKTNSFHNVFTSRTMPGYTWDVPRQPNLIDCGAFVLRSLVQFGKEKGFTYTLSTKVCDLSDWYTSNDGVIFRNRICTTLKKLIQEQKNTLNQLRLKG
eukprot:109769_1